jgi:hypothetical protein
MTLGGDFAFVIHQLVFFHGDFGTPDAHPSRVADQALGSGRFCLVIALLL